MKNPKKISSFEEPSIIEFLGDNTYYFNYNIIRSQITINSLDTGQDETKDEYTYIQVQLYGQPNYKDCVQAIVRQYISLDEEFDILNSYNSSIINGDTESVAINNYKDYLSLLSIIKQNISTYFENINY